MLARIEERLLVEGPLDESRRIRADVAVIEHDTEVWTPPGHGGGTAVADAPLVVRGRDSEIIPQRYITLLDAGTSRVVTIIDFLSPSNKLPGDGNKQYLQKQAEAIEARVNLVEIDLTRSGPHMLAHSYSLLPAEYQTTYVTCVTRWHDGRQHEIYRMPLDKKLPAIAIPLRKDDKDVVLNLQDAIARVYDEGAFDVINYKRECIPPLVGRDAELAGAFLKPA